MPVFDTQVQSLKYQVLKEVTEASLRDDLIHAYRDIPNKIIPGPRPNYRCCIFKERAVIRERIHMAMGGEKGNDNTIQVIPIACDECPVGGYEVSRACRGCIAHRCQKACPKDAISFDEKRRAVIDKDKCIECGRCQKACPYNAIVHHKRPCQVACQVDAITMDENNAAKINEEKCIECGACVYQCPFGAITDKSEILEVVETMKNRDVRGKTPYAIVAPSIASQFTDVSLSKVVSGIKTLGFDEVYEAALGADMAALLESRELAEKGFLTSSCCPSFVQYIKKHMPQMEKHVSHNKSPMVIMGEHIKKHDPDAYVVFIGPCTSKKKEAKNTAIDNVLTFEELQALIDAYDINLKKEKERSLDNASYFGRIFARSGGLSSAMTQAFKEQKIDFDFKPLICSGIKESKIALMKASKNLLKETFIEGMACEGGCVGGPCCLTHGPKNPRQIDAYGKQAYQKNMKEAVEPLH